jgi:hypothetical protein
MTRNGLAPARTGARSRGGVIAVSLIVWLRVPRLPTPAFLLHSLGKRPVRNGDENTEKDQADDADQHAHDSSHDGRRRDITIAYGGITLPCSNQSE